MRIRIAVFLAAIFGAALFLVAGTGVAQTEQRVALVIGNSAYKESPLANPGNDAADMAKALSEAGFKVILRRNANTRAMREAVREFGSELRRAQVGLFYYAGHGVQVRGNNYLIPVAADIRGEADVEDQAIDANYVLRTMEEAQAKVNIVILDACRNNPYASGFRSASRGLAQMTAATGTVIAFSTAPGSIAADGSGRNGLYTQHLLASLRQPDTDILKVFQRTRAGVVRETGGRQTPWESTSLTGDFYFRPGTHVASAAPSSAAIAAPAMDAEIVFWDSMKSSTNPADFQAYLDQYPDGRFAALARNRVKPADAAPQGSAQVASIAPSSTGAVSLTDALGSLGRQLRSVGAIKNANMEAVQEPIGFQSCDIRYIYKGAITVEPSNPTRFSTTVTIPLTQIDTNLTTIAPHRGHWAASVRIANGVKSIALVSDGHRATDSYANVEFRDEESARRWARALHEAVALCRK